MTDPCPLCGVVVHQVGVPNKSCGLAFSEVDAQDIYTQDRVSPVPSTPAKMADRVAGMMWSLGKQILWCPCGRMMWVQGMGWLVTLDFIVRLAASIRQLTPNDYASLMATLAQVMPLESGNVAAVLGEEPT